jgi:hypothetical protein
MSDTSEDLQIEFDGLRREITSARKNASDFARRHFNGTRENALVFCLQRAADIAKGCDLMGEARLLAPLYTLTRGLLESLIWVCWIAKSSENAQVFVDAPVNELKRIARKNLATGFAKVKDKITGEDKTEELLESDWPKGIPRRLRIEDLAKSAGLERIYTQLYGPLSMQAHGSVFEFELSSPEEELLGVMALANVLMECINTVVQNWIVNRRQIPATEIHAILKGAA